MKILIGVHNLSNGGAEHVAALWANGFANRENEVIVVTSEKMERSDFTLLPQVRVENIYVSGNAIARYVKKLCLLRKLLKDTKPDVALAVLKPWSEWLLLTTVGLKTKVINTEHDSFERPVTAPMDRQTFFRKFWLNRLYPAVTVLSEADKEVIGKRLKNVYVMPNPLAFAPHNVIDGKKKVVLAAGRLDQWHVKGFDLLVQAWGMIAANNPAWELHIAGRGSERDIRRIEGWCKDYSVERQVKLLGFCRDFEEQCRKASIFVLSSRYEGFGMVLIEAMSQGCAPVTSDYKGRASEIITNKNEGIVCAVDSADELASGIECLIKNEAFRHDIQLNACRRSRYYSLSNTIERWDSIFEKIGL